MTESGITSRREVRYLGVDDELRKASGEQVYSVSTLGVQLSVSNSFIFIPWNRVVDLSYHLLDEEIRKVVRGY